MKMEVKDKKNKISIIDKTIENLKPQLKEYTEKAEYFNIMKLKAEGALEVLLQIKTAKEEK